MGGDNDKEGYFLSAQIVIYQMKKTILDHGTM